MDTRTRTWGATDDRGLCGRGDDAQWASKGLEQQRPHRCHETSLPCICESVTVGSGQWQCHACTPLESCVLACGRHVT